MKHVFLLDLTRHLGPVQDIVGPAQEYLSKFTPEVIKWYLKPDQVGQNGLPAKDTVRVEDNVLISRLIEQDLRSLESADRAFHVLSDNPSVLFAAARATDPQLLVSTLHFASIRTGAKPASATVSSHNSTLPSSTAQGEPPQLLLKEALALTKNLLAQGHHTTPETALPQTQLRGLLSEATKGRARKTAHPKSRSLISDIVRMGVSEGWLRQVTLGGRSGTERLFLQVAEMSNAVPASTRATELSKPAETVSVSKTRTQSMIKCLKDRFIYSPKDVRDLLFAAVRVQKLDLKDAPKKAGLLLHGALAAAKSEASHQDIEFLYWGAAADAFMEMMLAAGVLRTADDTSLKPSPYARTEMVSAISEDLEDRCEAYLLEYLISKMADITLRDRLALAHALFKVSPQKKQAFELQDRVDEVLAVLRDRVSERSDGCLALDPL